MWCKNDPVGHPKSESDNIRLRLPVLLGIRLRLHPKTSDSLRLHNPGGKKRHPRNQCSARDVFCFRCQKRTFLQDLPCTSCGFQEQVSYCCAGGNKRGMPRDAHFHKYPCVCLRCRAGLQSRMWNIQLRPFQNFRLRPFQNFWLRFLNIREWNLDVKINGNRGAQQEISVSTKVSKEIVPFQQEFPILECDVKNDPIGYPESESDKKSDSDSQCCEESDYSQKPPTPYESEILERSDCATWCRGWCSCCWHRMNSEPFKWPPCGAFEIETWEKWPLCWISRKRPEIANFATCKVTVKLRGQLYRIVRATGLRDLWLTSFSVKTSCDVTKMLTFVSVDQGLLRILMYNKLLPQMLQSACLNTNATTVTLSPLSKDGIQMLTNSSSLWK